MDNCNRFIAISRLLRRRRRGEERVLDAVRSSVLAPFPPLGAPRCEVLAFGLWGGDDGDANRHDRPIIRRLNIIVAIEVPAKAVPIALKIPSTC